VPVYQTIPWLMRNPLTGFEKIGWQSRGEPVRLDLGFFRPYLVTRPEHVQHVLRDQAANYLREGMTWEPFRRLVGNGIAGEGPSWEPHRSFFQTLFSGKNIGSMIDQMATSIADAVDGLDGHARAARPIDAAVEMTRIVQRAIIRVFFGDRISSADADRLGDAIAQALTSLGARMLLPFVPDSVPLPGDRAFARTNKIVNEIILPLVRESRTGAAKGGDVVSLLCQARDENGALLTEQQVRDDVVAIFVAGTETTALALTWLWVLLDSHPQVAARLYEEVDGVVGADPVGQSHLPGLRYTKMVLQEVLRLRPLGWILPRTAMRADTIGGVPVSAGSTVILSPYLTQRMPEHWERPLEFDPERFSPERAERRHRFAYFPFGGGPHQCLGSHFFMVEAQLILATLLRRYRPLLHTSSPIEPQASLSLRPRRKVEVVLSPLG
jgi:cytochrome P450